MMEWIVLLLFSIMWFIQILFDYVVVKNFERMEKR